MELLGSLLDQFVGSFDHANGLSTLRFDAVDSLIFQQRF